MDEKNLRAYFVEMVGTFALVFVSAGAVMVNLMGGLQPASVSIALAAGLVYATALAFTVPISGGYLNPAVVVTLWVFKRMDGFRATGLVFGQVLGAFLAGLLLRVVFPYREDVFTATHLGTPHLNLEAFDPMHIGTSVNLITIVKGIGIEMALTFILVMVLYATALDPRGPRRLGAWAGKLPALWLGLALAAVTIVGYPLTGAAVNPARWVGTALAELTVESLRTQAFVDHAVYWIGPIAGALLAGWIYTAFVLEEQESPSVAHTKPGAGSAAAAAAVGSTLYRAKK
jgi:aquaporin Z